MEHMVCEKTFSHVQLILPKTSFCHGELAVQGGAINHVLPTFPVCKEWLHVITSRLSLASLSNRYLVIYWQCSVVFMLFVWHDHQVNIICYLYLFLSKHISYKHTMTFIKCDVTQSVFHSVMNRFPLCFITQKGQKSPCILVNLIIHI
jgi:hypothetical protein